MKEEKKEIREDKLEIEILDKGRELLGNTRGMCCTAAWIPTRSW